MLSFGAVSVNPTGVTDTELQVSAPGGFGTVDVTVTNRAGQSPISAADQFTYF